MSDKDYIKELEERLVMMDKIVEGKDNEINLLKKNYSPQKRIQEKLERKCTSMLDVNELRQKIHFKFSINQEDLQDIMSFYDDDTALAILKETINNATMVTIAEYFNSDKKKYP
jgi:ABC-type uncharacterized transport system ATPase subunit